ncbi:KAP family NTPase [Ornithinimicrobium pekingense]|uniref:KAP NTPase domain-containing protein n=1 Tax=Ornithinimicrobium pekingense TaxID=384677 RepID=A0ABQ2FF15_9MICO|nr:P-loop NTPase fold protein [Ornithinimicrobium pekingense]GGK79361.1 hypothetical protein GCM10011509_29830 [Ornithinimicrobium pekingense]
MAEGTWTDEALRSGKGDTLGRLAYARRAAELIHSTHSFESSAVFGLSGPWGSGKTSLVNMIVEELVTAHSKWEVARFTPWATSDILGLLSEFYASLAEVLPKKKGEQFRRALAVTATVAAPAANLIPIVGGVAAEGVRTAGDALGKSPSWQAAFKKASDELKDLGKPILVVVDDIDRLHGDELTALLKVVRLLGRFDGVQYLLAYDDETLYRSMNASGAVNPHDGSAERYMEKIVQYPLFVPPLLQHQQLSRLNAGLLSISREIAGEGAYEDRLGGLVDCFSSLLTTPRAIDRYVAQLRHHIPLLPPDEVDDGDVHILTLIRVSFPALFSAIPRYKSELISGHTGDIKFGGDSLEYEPFDIDPLLEVVPPQLRGVARRLMVSLFPNIRATGQFSTFASSRRQSVHYGEYFDRYFAMGILDHDVSDATVAAAVEAAIRGDATPLTDLFATSTDEIRGLVLSKGASPANQPSTDVGRIHLAEVLAGVANQLPSDDRGLLTDLDQVFGWTADLLGGIDEDTSPSVIVDVLRKLATQPLRIRAWRRLENSVRRTFLEKLPPWYIAVTKQLVQEAADDLLQHLKQGDAAPTSSGVGYQIHFVLRHDAEGLRSRVHELLDSTDVDLAILASRLVSARSTTGGKPNWQLSPDFDQETFNQLAPPGDDPWYHEPVQKVDLHDLSWVNRRRFAAGRVSSPPAPPAVPEADPPAHAQGD